MFERQREVSLSMAKRNRRDLAGSQEGSCAELACKDVVAQRAAAALGGARQERSSGRHVGDAHDRGDARRQSVQQKEWRIEAHCVAAVLRKTHYHIAPLLDSIR